MKNTIRLLSFLFLAACSENKNTRELNLQTSSGIIGGQSVNPDEPIYHTTVQLIEVFETTTWVNHEGITEPAYRSAPCTATILSDSVILTAAHCTLKDPKNLYVYFSADRSLHLRDELAYYGRNPLFRRITGGIVPQAWTNLPKDQSKNWNDLALLKFSGGLPDGYKPAKLIYDSPFADVYKALNTSSVYLAGFGWLNQQGQMADHLQRTAVTVTDQDYSATEFVFGNDDGHGACHGDSGGPAYVQLGFDFVVIGVTSRADDKDPEGHCTDGTIYTKVAAFKDWIRENKAKA